jgi:Uncharacterised nucleotidyltransferase
MSGGWFGPVHAGIGATRIAVRGIAVVLCQCRSKVAIISATNAGSLVTTTASYQLLEFLLADDGKATAVARRFFESQCWREAIAVAKAWNAIPQLFDRIGSLGLKLTAADTAKLRFEYLNAYRQSAFRAAKAIGAIHNLEQAGIPAVAFKGIASIAVLYGDPKHRTIHDADILILKKDLPNALARLERQGFARRGSETLAQYLRFVEESPGFAGNQALTLYGDGGSEIDLHWDLHGSGLPAEEILERAVPVDLMGSTIPVVDAQDGILLTVHHTIRENFAIESVCRDLVDARLWLQYLRETGRLEAVMKWAAESRVKVAALTVATLLSGYDDTTAAAQAAVLLSGLASPAERRSATSLAELFHYQLRHGRLGKDVFYLVHSRPWRQIFRGLATDWSGYRQSMQTLEKQLGEERPLHERVARLAKSIPSLRGLRLARELACIKFGTN